MSLSHDWEATSRVRVRTVFVLLAIATLTGCPGKSPASAASTANANANPQANVAKATQLTGSVTAANGIVAAGGGNIVAQGGGNIVAQGGGNFLGHNGSALRVLATGDHPLAGTDVFLFDGKGDKVAQTTTDAQGHYKFDVTSSKSYRVVAAGNQDGKLAKLMTLVAAGQGSGNVSMATTCMAAECLTKASGSLKGWDQGRFDKMVTECDKWLENRTEVPDMSDMATVSAWVEKDGDASLLAEVNSYVNDMRNFAGKVEDMAFTAAAQGERAASDAIGMVAKKGGGSLGNSLGAATDLAASYGVTVPKITL